MLGPKAAYSFAAPDPAGGDVLPGPQATTTELPPEERPAGRLKDAMDVLNTGEYSPALAKRNYVPHEPLMLKPTSSETSQVKPTFGLLVPPARPPLYSS